MSNVRPGDRPEDGAAAAQAPVDMLRACLRDVVGLLALPSLCHGRRPADVVEVVMDALCGTLAVDLAYVRLSAPDDAIEVARLAGRSDAEALLAEVREAVGPCLRERSNAPRPIQGPAGLGALQAVFVPLGFYAETGALVLAAARPDFPGALEAVVMRAGASLAASAIEGARLFAAAERERAAAEEASRAKDQFLAQVSHELRTPLTAIVGWLRLLRTGALTEEKRARALETIERNAHAQTQLIEDLLDIARITTGKLRLDVQPVELAAVMESAVEASRPAAEAKGIRVQALLDPAAGPVVGDPDRLVQVVNNLLGNAVKFTPKGGRVQVRLQRVDSSVEITVADSGEGIAPEFLPFVFERFRQADAGTTRKHGGLGLGLSIVRHLVEQHGGTVAVQSDGPGRGALFTVRLPVALARPPAVRPPGGLVECPPELAGLRVLVVDDDRDTRELLAGALQHCNAEVVAVASAAEALEHLRRARPDILVSDIGMPGETGYDLIHKVRALRDEEGRATPAVALTAHARSEDRTRALRAGFNTHVPKPVEPAELVVVIANLAGRFLRR